MRVIRGDTRSLDNSSYKSLYASSQIISNYVLFADFRAQCSFPFFSRLGFAGSR